MLMSDEVMLINYATTLLVSPKISFAGFVAKDGTGWLYSRQKMFQLSDIRDYSVKSILESNGLLKHEVKTDSGERVIALSQPVRDRGYVRLGYSKDALDQVFKERVRLKFKRFSVVGLIAILIGLFLARILSNHLSQPLHLLTKAAVEISKGNKGIQLPVHGSDELAKLTHTFNNMSKELSKLDEMKDDFMSHVTHELRSPLTSIIATVELMAEMPMMQKDEKLKRSIDRLVYGSERLNRLVDNILDLTKLEAGKMQFDIQPVNMGTIASEMADFFEPRAMEKGLEIKASVPRHMPLAMADPERIRQVLSNLIHNALKFTNRGEVVIFVRAKNDHIEVGVQDTGVGIPKDKLHTVFQKFESLQDTRNRVEKPVPGSGLGLNIVMNSIRAQGGTIWVESEIDKGSTFIFTLPLASADVQAKYLQSKVNETALNKKAPKSNTEPLINDVRKSIKST
jgi:signal transduction histidine kinase